MHFTDNFLLQLCLHLLNDSQKWRLGSFVAGFLISKVCLCCLLFCQDAALHWSSPPALKMPLADVSCRLAQLFISAGAKPDALNKEGQTPIMVAIMQVCCLLKLITFAWYPDYSHTY